MITNKFNYPELKRINNDLGRFYIDLLNNHVPSVTTVLNNISDKKTSLDQWRNRVGDVEADRVMKEATDIGSMVHLSLENYLNGIDDNIFTDDSLGNMAKKMTEKLISDALINISNVYGLEVHLVLDKLYAGTADCVGVIDGKDTIIDFKTSKRIKKKEWIDDYFMQAAAYAMAHNEVFETKIEHAAIFMCSRDCDWQLWEVGPEEFKQWEEKWARRVEEFYNLS